MVARYIEYKDVCYYLLGDLVIIVGVLCVCFLFQLLVFCRLLGNILLVCVVLFLVPGNSVCMYLSGLIAVYVCSSILFLYCCA